MFNNLIVFYYSKKNNINNKLKKIKKKSKNMLVKMLYKIILWNKNQKQLKSFKTYLVWGAIKMKLLS